MILRTIENLIIESLKSFPVVGVLGARQVGKTTLAKEIQKNFLHSIYLDLELPSDLNKLQEPELYLSQYIDYLVIIDEIQRMPILFPLIRALVDQKRVPGRFLILGSSSPDLMRNSSESLAGRVIYHELSPFNLQEIMPKDQSDLINLWLRGGYPDSYLSSDIESSLTWRQAFIKTYLERDIPQLGLRVPSLQLRKFWVMLAHNHGQLWNASQIANSLDVSAPTVRHYLDILEKSFVIRQLQPFFPNIKKRVKKSPKVYIRDSGLLHALLNLKTLDDLQVHPIIGASWEGFVIEQIISLLPEYWGKYFYRTNAGAEIDLIILKPPNKPIAIEIKYSTAPKVSRGFWIGSEDINCEKALVIYPGKEIYPIGERVLALPLSEVSQISSIIS